MLHNTKKQLFLVDEMGSISRNGDQSTTGVIKTTQDLIGNPIRAMQKNCESPSIAGNDERIIEPCNCSETAPRKPQ